jgi:hypothetical protein
MTQARRAELEARCQAFLADNEPTPAQLLEFVQQIEREVWEKAASKHNMVHINHHTKDYCDGYLQGCKQYAQWLHQQREGR